MQIVIPMSGFGERFRRAGYMVPKPLIKVEGKPMIQHVTDLYPGAERFIFICNEDHLKDTTFHMKEVLEQAPNFTIVPINAHKLGPVHAVLQASEHIALDQPMIINYCDFTCSWDFNDFRAFVKNNRPDGCVITYTGFHPHMLSSTNYAYVKTEAENPGIVFDIEEKQPYTETPTQEHASSGAYYFNSGSTALEYCRKTVELNLAIDGEFYVSLVYKAMLQDKCDIRYYDIPYFMQWGTPQDLHDYLYYSGLFKKQLNIPDKRLRIAGVTLLPMAGAGSRFVNEGYSTPKPLIAMSGKPMVLQALNDLPLTPKTILVTHNMADIDLQSIRETLDKETTLECINIDEVTDGQARTCMMVAHLLKPEEPVTIGACDNGVLYDHKRFTDLLDDDDCDVIVWGAVGFPGAIDNPKAYGWLAHDGGRILRASVKAPLSDPTTDPVIIGTFTFKKARFFKDAAQEIFHAGSKVNGEYYVDSLINVCIQQGLNVKILLVSHYICWGTPANLKTFEYWQNCFDLWPNHPYKKSLDQDFVVNESSLGHVG